MLQGPKDQPRVAAALFGGQCVLPLAAGPTSTTTYSLDARTLPKTRVWGSEPENVHCSRAIRPLKIELRWGCEESSKKTAVGSGVTFKYDPFGRRIYKSSSSATSVYAYDGDNLVEETNSAGGVVARYEQTQNIDEPLAMLRSSATSYFEQDGVGSVTSLSNAAGALAQTYTFDSFGKQTASSGSLTNPFQYTAREFDSETGLYFLRSRYYDTTTGRFLSEDPIQFVTGAPYSYASNNPVIFADPFGLAPGDWWDPRTPGNFWGQWNPFNPNSGLSNTANSIGDSLSGMLTGDWKKVANSYDNGPLGTTAKCKCSLHTAEKGAVGGAGVAAAAAGGLIILDAAGISSIGESQIGWKGGEITFTRPGCNTPDFRFNPFGDDDWPPHYHRRPGIGKHRPWEGW